MRYKTIAVAICLLSCTTQFAIALGASSTVHAEATATGKSITPNAAPGAIFQNLFPNGEGAPKIHANLASAIAVSPNGKMLAIVTSGSNRHYRKSGELIEELSTEYVFLFDITAARPRQIQVLRPPNAFLGLAWGVNSDSIFVSGGKDDLVHEYRRGVQGFAEFRTIPLGHHSAIGREGGTSGPMTAQLAVSPDGARLLVSNTWNDSVSLIDLANGKVITERDLRPGKIDPKDVGKPGGANPGSITWVANDRVYVASERDREVIALKIDADLIRVTGRTAVEGQPVALLANRAGTRLFAALDNADRVAIFDASNGVLLEQVSTLAPVSVYVNAKKLGGANPDALALTPDQRTLLVSNGGQNSIAVVQLSDLAAAAANIPEGDDDNDKPARPRQSVVVGLAPTGWFPTGIATAKNGSAWYVINGKSPAGPNGLWCKEPKGGQCYGGQTPKHPIYTWAGQDGFSLAPSGQAFESTMDMTVLQLERAGFLTMPPPRSLDLARLTRRVARNNGFENHPSVRDLQLIAFVHQHIKHVIYIIKENRSYDQILGDLEEGNGDPRLALFPERITPNHHAIARNFVTLDNLLVSGEGSWTGWQWSTSGRTSVYAERHDFVSLAERGEDGGGSRGVLTVFPTSAERHAEDPKSPIDPDILPGTRDVAEIDGPGANPGTGYIWDGALRAGLTVRNYGFFSRSTPQGCCAPEVKMVHSPFDAGIKVTAADVEALKDLTDPYYYMWFNVPNFWNIQEWKREFSQFVQKGTLPNLMLVQLAEDHFGGFQKAIDGVNTPETQMADNDYALGLLVQTVAESRFASSTLVVTIEDDTWDGVDHADAFRTVALFAGAYVRKNAVVSTRYTTVNVVKTILAILGAGPLGINDALAAPMLDVFDPKQKSWAYDAKVPDILYSTQIPLPKKNSACIVQPTHPASYWVQAMSDQDFSHVDAGKLGAGNRGLWKGLKGDQLYPDIRSGEDLRANRQVLLERYRSAEPAGCFTPAPD